MFVAPLLVALALSPAPQVKEKLPPPMKLEAKNWTVRYVFGSKDPTSIGLVVYGDVPLHYVERGTEILLGRVAGDVPKNVLLLEVGFKRTLGPPIPRFPGQEFFGCSFSMTPKGEDAALTEVWIRDTHRRVLLKLPIGSKKKGP